MDKDDMKMLFDEKMGDNLRETIFSLIDLYNKSFKTDRELIGRSFMHIMKDYN